MTKTYQFLPLYLKNTLSILLLITSIFCISPVRLYASIPEVTLSWEKNPEGPSPTGYRVYYGTESGNYTGSIDVGNSTQYTLSLPPGTYYAAVTAYNQSGESSFSEETSFTLTEDSAGYDSPFIEIGEIELNHTWQRVQFTKPFTNPVVIANGISYNGHDPSVLRIRNVDQDGFDIRIEEWNYLDGWHTKEKAGYIVMEAGEYVLPDGTKIEAGKFVTNRTNRFLKVSFGSTFNKVPVLITSITTFHGIDAVTGRVKRLSTSGFWFCMQEQESNRHHTHAPEEISYLAWEPSTGNLGSLHFDIANMTKRVNHHFTTASFNEPFNSAPILLVSMQTTYGGDTASLRWENKDYNGFCVKVEEERSRDSETWHVREKIGFMALSMDD